MASKSPTDHGIGSDSPAARRGVPGQRGQSRIPAFYKLPVAERLRAMHERGLLSDDDLELMLSGDHTLPLHVADRMIENVVGVLGLPVGLGLNFLVNGRDHVVPLAVEEPSIVAALSSAARTARVSGGFQVSTTEPVLIGQVQVVDLADPEAARAAVLDHREDILNQANALHPKMLARGGGARDLEVHLHTAPSDGRRMLVVHLLVDTRDAMGANLVNTMCEGVAPLVETITGGTVFLRILSNYTDRARATARVSIPAANLAGKGFTGEAVRDGIVLANDFATVDPYRAATHNKGIMNGVDAVALATGNDWRAIEAAAHAWAARDGQYRSLTRWWTNPDSGNLEGELDIPMKVGTVGGPLQTNPTVGISHRILGLGSATELAGLMAVVGLAQNFSALKALVTSGIQQGHMTLHARSVASAAGAPDEHFESVVEQLIESGEIKVWKAEEIIRSLGEGAAPAQPDNSSEPRSAAHGKVILLGEHAVVHGSRAIAAPIPLAVEARVQDPAPGSDAVHLLIPRWGIEQRVRGPGEQPQAFDRTLDLIFEHLDLAGRGMTIEVFPRVPRAMGLGGSAAVAVAIIRALDSHYSLGLDDAAVNALAFECEKVAHGTPSGVDNTLATYGQFMQFRMRRDGNGGSTAPDIQPLSPAVPLPVVIGSTGRESLTAVTVARVRAAWQRHPARYERIFDEIDHLAGQGAEAVTRGDLTELGELMNLNQGLLNALQVSSRELEDLVQIARSNGALGAKLTGGGGGGSMLALCPDDPARVAAAMRNAGYDAMEVTLG